MSRRSRRSGTAESPIQISATPRRAPSAGLNGQNRSVCRKSRLARLLNLEKLGGRTRARTWDPMIKSHLLYQLSYAPGLGPEKAFARGRRLAKRFPDVQQSRGSFPGLWPRPGRAKSRWISAASARVPDRLGKPVLRAAPGRPDPVRHPGRTGCGQDRGPGRHRHDPGPCHAPYGGAASPRRGLRTGDPCR